MKTLREQLGKPVLFHWLGWHGKDGIANSIPGYDSRDPGVIKAQLDAMQDWGGDGAGVIALTYGPTVSPFIHQASMAMCDECNSRGMPFALCFDPWTVKASSDKNAAMIAALVHSDTQMMLNSPSYLPGRPILDFATGADPKLVKAAVPEVQYWIQGVDYDWVKIPEQPNKTPLPCAYLQFNDGTGKDRNKQIWDQTLPVRLVPPLAGRTFWNRNVSGAKSYIQVVTWNDYAEGTQVEPFAAVLTGKI